MLQEDRDRERYEIYANQCLWTIAAGLHSLGGADFDMPQYVELVHPETKKDQQSAEQIKEDILKLLEG